MDEAFAQLEMACEQSLANLPDFGPTSTKQYCHSLNNEHDERWGDSFDLTAWRQLIGKTQLLLFKLLL